MLKLPDSERFVVTKVTDLTEDALNWAVAKAMGFEEINLMVHRNYLETWIQIEIIRNQKPIYSNFVPCRDWSCAGNVLQYFKLAIVPDGSNWLACVCNGLWPGGELDQEGSFSEAESPLVAICRAAVTHKFGESVGVPSILQPAKVL